ncbi:MAG: flagellar biosynthetic protein FliR [Oscillospiraceae bacterium]
MTQLGIAIDGLPVYMCIFVRLAAIIFLNPLFMSSHVPTQIKAALVFVCTLMLAPYVSSSVTDTGFLSLALALLREFLTGFALTYVFTVFFYMLMTAADVMDAHLGWSMAKMFNPQTNIQSGISGLFLTILFGLYFFVTNSHLVLIKTAAYSFVLIPAGAGSIHIRNIPEFAITVFVSAFSLALRLAIPFVAASFVVQISMGVLMKLIPQIHVFVIYMQAMNLLGMLLLLVLGHATAGFVESYIEQMFKAMQQAVAAFVSS